MAAAVKQYKLPDELPKWAHVSVSWEDAMTDGGAHQSEEFLKTWSPCMRKTSGYVLCYDANYIIIASTDDRGSGTDGDCEDVTVFLRSMIRRVIRRK